MRTVLTIAGFDPSSGAGVTADLMVFAAHGLFGTSCITALTVQSTLEVRSTYPVSAEIVGETLACLDADLQPAGIKLGMVGSKPNILRISNYLAQLNVKDAGYERSPSIPLVLDPVIRSSSGRELLDPDGVAALRDLLLPLVHWITPNMDELAVLLSRSVVDRGDIPDACRDLQASAGRLRKEQQLLGVVATGGDFDPPNDFLLTPSGEAHWLTGSRVATKSTHGTGCAFSSAFLSRLVLGDEPKTAALSAKAYVVGALTAATAIGGGRGPVNHLWDIANLVHTNK